MTGILDQLAAEARERVAAARSIRSAATLPAEAEASPRPAGPNGEPYPFERALAAPGLAFICEVKKASPSRGLISPDFPYLDIARDYVAGGAAAISVLTEPVHFLGSTDYLRQIATAVDVPVLRKDFIVDASQLYETRLLGASAVLLICAILTPAQIADYLGLADELGLSCLVEARDADEVAVALAAGARVIGVNNRNLDDFSLDTGTATGLRRLVPPGHLFVAESGVTTPEDVAAVAASGADAVLIGEALMRARDRRAVLAAMREAAVAAVTRAPEAAGRQGVVVTDESPDDGATAPIVKICGITDEDDVDVLNETHPDYVGFIFVEGSKREIDLARAMHIRRLLDHTITTVGVFVDQPVADVADALMSGTINVAQLHGHEDAGYIDDLRDAAPDAVIIKAVKVTDAEAIVAAASLGADWLLLDSGMGSGRPFDWSLVEEVRASGVHLPPLFLAGGLDPDNVAAGVAAVHPAGVDVSTGVESGHHKDPDKIRAFIAAARDQR